MAHLDKPDKERLKTEIHQEIWKIIRIRETNRVLKNKIWTSLSILCVVAAGWGLWRMNQQQEQKLDMLAKSTIIYQVESHNALMILPDSTRVLLEKGSTLSYSADFNSKEFRSVHLEGRAFFDVKRDPLKPFVVQSGDLKVQVLGTAFDIDSRNPQDSKVTVQEGSVRVDHKVQQLDILKPQEQLRFVKDGMRYTKAMVTDEQYMEWQFSDDLVFDNVSIQDACVVFARKFGFTFEFRGLDIKYVKFTTLFKKGESFEHILKSISAFTNTKYVMDRTNNVIIFKN